MEMREMINFAIISTTNEILSLEGNFHLSEQFFFELFLDFFSNPHMVDTHTGLSAVQILPEDNSQDGTVDVGSFINDNRAFTTQFQEAWSQIFSCFNCHHPAGGCTAGEAYHIEWLFAECLSHFDLPLDHSVILYIIQAILLSICQSNSSLRTFEVQGASSLGFRITLFPAEMAAATSGIAVQIGQFQADITNTRPSGYCSTAQDATPTTMGVQMGLGLLHLRKLASESLISLRVMACAPKLDMNWLQPRSCFIASSSRGMNDSQARISFFRACSLVARSLFQTLAFIS